MSINVVVQFNALPASRKAFESIMRSVAKDLPGVDGCQSVQVLQNSEDTCRFTLVEVWDTKEIHQSHIDGLIADGTWAAIAEHLKDDPVSGYFQSV
jgi:quinol monooxygenase YgiN